MAERKRQTKTLVIDMDTFEALQAKALELGLAFKSPRIVLRYVLGLEKVEKAKTTRRTAVDDSKS